MRMDARNGSLVNGHDYYSPPRRLLGPDGLPITSEKWGKDGYPLPHVIQMGAVIQSGFEVFWDRWDEARRHSRENALAMEKDCFLQSLLQERALATATLKWHVHCDDEKDPYQKALKDGMQRVLMATPFKTRMHHETLKGGLWYGRTANQRIFEWRELSVPVVKAMPIQPPSSSGMRHLAHTGQPGEGIGAGAMPPEPGRNDTPRYADGPQNPNPNIGAGGPAPRNPTATVPQRFARERYLAAPPQGDPFAGGLPGNPAGVPAAVTTVDERRRSLVVKKHQPVHGDSIYHKFDGTPVILAYNPAAETLAGAQTTYTTAGSRAVVLTGTWRERFVVYSQESKPAEFFDYERAEAIHGAGLRDVAYWSWWMKTEYLEWFSTFFERFGLGLRLWGYEAGNDASYQEVFKLATASSRRVNVLVPIFGGKSGQQQVGGLTSVETPIQGADAIRVMLEYFDAQMERYFVGQSMSGGADSESGLGGTGRAKFAANTKYQLVKYDAENLADCYTADWVRVAQRWTYPEAQDVPLEWRFNVPDPDNAEKLEGVEKAISFGVDFKKDEVRGLTGMSDPQPGDDIVGGAAQLATELAAEVMAGDGGGQNWDEDPDDYEGGKDRAVADGVVVRHAGPEMSPGQEYMAKWEARRREAAKTARRAQSLVQQASDIDVDMELLHAEHPLLKEVTRLVTDAGFPIEETRSERADLARRSHEAITAAMSYLGGIDAKSFKDQDERRAHRDTIRDLGRMHRRMKKAESLFHESSGKSQASGEGKSSEGPPAAVAAPTPLTAPPPPSATVIPHTKESDDPAPAATSAAVVPPSPPAPLPDPSPKKGRNAVSRMVRHVGRMIGLLERAEQPEPLKERLLKKDGQGNLLGYTERYVTDASGHEHEPAGSPGGGQFAKSGLAPIRKKLSKAEKARAEAEMAAELAKGGGLVKPQSLPGEGPAEQGARELAEWRKLKGATEATSPPLSGPALARAAEQTAMSVPDARHGGEPIAGMAHKVLISELYDALKDRLGMDEEGYKAELLKAHTAGQIRLHRLDLPQPLDERFGLTGSLTHQRRSEIRHAGATFHLVEGRE